MGGKRYKVGDIFYAPIEPTAQYEEKKVKVGESDGKYIPNPTDRVCVGQVLCDGLLGIFVVYFNKLMTQEEAVVMNIDKVSEMKPLLMHATTSSPFNRGWWPRLGNRVVSESLPIPALRIYPILDIFDSYTVFDYYNAGKLAVSGSKIIPVGEAHKFPGSSTATSGMLTDMAAHYFGIAEISYYEDYKYDFFVNEEAAVWNIFPEIYEFGSNQPRPEH